MKKISILLVSLLTLLLLSTTACNNIDNPTQTISTITFTDSLNREVLVPQQIDRIAISGQYSQIVLFALCPDKLVGIANQWDENAEHIINEKYLSLPVLGQLYGGKGPFNLETLLDLNAQLIIDVGEEKEGLVEDLNDLQNQTGIPVVHVTITSIQTTGNAYRLLGKLLNMEKEANKIADYCDNMYKRTKDISNIVDKVDVLYITGTIGQNVIAKSSYHAEIIDLLCNNIAVVDSPSAKGTGNEVDMEQILKWNPEVIFFAPGSVYDSVSKDAIWSKLDAIKNNKYYEVPSGPYNWIGWPPSVQRYLGMMWMSKILYPEETSQYDLYTDVHEYYEIFYHCDLTREQFNALVAKSINN